jgi:uncharacterized membrane protein HdeD (DUF308 family)
MNNRGRLVVDGLLAVAVAVLTLVLAAGLGVVAIIVGVVAIVGAISFGAQAIARRWRRQPVRDRPRGTRRG